MRPRASTGWWQWSREMCSPPAARLNSKQGPARVYWMKHSLRCCRKRNAWDIAPLQLLLPAQHGEQRAVDQVVVLARHRRGHLHRLGLGPALLQERDLEPPVVDLVLRLVDPLE